MRPWALSAACCPRRAERFATGEGSACRPPVSGSESGSLAYQPVDGRHILGRVEERDQFPVDHIPIPLDLRHAHAARSDLYLRPGVGQGIGSPMGKNGFLRPIERETGRGARSGPTGICESGLDKIVSTCYDVFAMLSGSRTMTTPIEEAKQRIRELGGTVRTGEALEAGIHPRTFYALRDSGELEQLSWGVYRLAELPSLTEPDLATVAKRIPEGVVCLISALAVHELTTQIPHAVHLALQRGTRYPTLDYPPLRVYLFSKAAFAAGVEERRVDEVPVRIFNAEKTLADCFKFRHKIGLAVATEALRMYRGRPGTNLQRIYEYAQGCRVANVIRPYLEAGL